MKIKTATAFIIVLLVAAVLMIARPGDRFRSAWAFSNPALIGNWSGTMETPTGDRFPVFLTMTFHDSAGGLGRGRTPRRGYGSFDGRFVVCEPSRTAVEYSLEGSPNDRHGATLAFFTEAAIGRDGLTPGWFNASWDGADAIQGRVSFSWRQGQSAISGPDYPDTQGEGVLALTRMLSDPSAADCANVTVPTNPSDRIQKAGLVTDAANVLSSEQEQALSVQLEQMEKATATQVVVATVPDLEGQDIAVFARNLSARWQVGHPHMDDGVVVLVVPKEHRARIAVGGGLAHRLSDAASQAIMDEQMVPRFKESDYAGGLAAGIRALTAHLD